MLYVSFAPALPSFAWMFAYLPARLPAWYSNYYYFLDGCEESEPLLLLFFKIVLFSFIRTDPLSQYRFSIFVLIRCIGIVFLIVLYNSGHLLCYHLTCHYLTPDSWMLSSDTCLISLITYHLIYYHLTCDYNILRILSCYPILYTVTCISRLMYFGSPELSNLSCPCYSRNMIII